MGDRFELSDSGFLKQLKHRDEGIADRWKTATGGKRSTPIGPTILKKIVFPTIATGKITGDQAHAIALVGSLKLSQAALLDLSKWIKMAYEGDYFFKGEAKPLLTAEALRSFYAALGMGNIGKINFVSPGTGLEYTPDLYSAIRWLVFHGKIHVFEVDAAMLQDDAGLYRSDSNIMTLYAGVTPDESMMTIVHETTHSIQDYRDLVAKHKFTEADAYIAGAVAALNANKDFAGFRHPASKIAAGLVLAGQATLKNTDWTKAYANVVKAVEKDRLYRFKSDELYKGDIVKDGEDEQASLTTALKYFNVEAAVAKAFAAAISPFQ